MQCLLVYSRQEGRVNLAPLNPPGFARGSSWSHTGIAYGTEVFFLKKKDYCPRGSSDFFLRSFSLDLASSPRNDSNEALLSVLSLPWMPMWACTHEMVLP